MARPIEGGDGLAVGCRYLRDQVAGLLAEYKADATTEARRQEIIGQLRNIGSDWVSVGCQAAFGDLTFTLQQPKPGIHEIPPVIQAVMKEVSV
jgi:hypothetical protein